MVHLGGVEGHLLDHLVVGGGAALDDVGREGEGRAHETEDGGVVAHLLAKQAEGLAHEADGLLRLEVGEGLDVVHAADGVHDDGAGALDNVEGNVHAGEGSEDVREEDDAVGLERLPGLQGDLDGEVDGLGALAEGGVLLAQVLVDLHVATRLAHHPDGGALDVLAADGAEHEGVLSAGRLGVRGGVHLDGAERSGALGGSDARGRPLGGRIAGGTRAHGEGGLGGHAEGADDGGHGLEGEWGGEEAPWRRCVQTRRGLCLGKEGRGEALTNNLSSGTSSGWVRRTQSHWLTSPTVQSCGNVALFHHTEVRCVEILGWRSLFRQLQ